MSRNILIVDSDIGFAFTVKKALEETGRYTLRTVTRIRPAVAAVQETTFDVALVDLEIEYVEVGEMLASLRAIQPDLPIIITSRYEQNAEQVHPLAAASFLNKPYQARAAIEAIERVLNPPAQTTQPSVAQIAEDHEVEELLQASRQSAGTLTLEPPHSADDSTISEILAEARSAEVSQRIYATLDPAPMPDDPTLLLEGRQPVEPPQDDSEPIGPTPAEEVLNLTATPPSLDVLLQEIRNYFTTGTQAPDGILNGIEPPLLPFQTTGSYILPPPTDQETRLDFIPPPPTLPELDIPPDTGPLIAATLQEITQQLTAIEIEVVSEHLQEAEAALTSEVLAHYALQVTQFALESSSIGALLTQEDQRLAQAGDLDENAWETLSQLVRDNWSLPGDARTRVLYRRLDMGEILLYSIQTVEGLTLTLIFSAETPLKHIRRQAARLAESLATVPTPTPEMLQSELPITLEPSEEVAEAEATGPLFIAAREGTSDIPAIATEAPTAQESAIESAPAAPPARPSTLVYYACAWLVEDSRDNISPAAAPIIERWLREICAGEGWEAVSVRIDAEWLYVEVGVPPSVLPNQVAGLLMGETTRRALDLDPARSHQSPWSAGYLVHTPPHSLTEQDIQRFAQFYRATPRLSSAP